MEKVFAIVLRGNNIHWFDEERKGLVKLSLVRARYNLETRKSTHEWAMAGDAERKVILETDYDPATPDTLPRFYAGPNEFEKGNTMSAIDLFRMADVYDVCRYHNLHVIAEGDGRCYTWIFSEGQAQKWYLNDHINVVTNHYSADGYVEKITYDADVPENYGSVEDVYKYNDWTEIDENGGMINHEGVYNRLRLEPDQEALMDKLEKIIEECGKSGISLRFDMANYEISAINMRKIKRIEYDPGYSEETEAAYRYEHSQFTRTINGIRDICSDDSCYQFVIDK